MVWPGNSPPVSPVLTPDVGSQSDSGISPVGLQRYSGTFDILSSGVCSAAPDTAMKTSVGRQAHFHPGWSTPRVPGLCWQIPGSMRRRAGGRRNGRSESWPAVGWSTTLPGERCRGQRRSRRGAIASWPARRTDIAAAEELQGFGQCPLDPGACRVALTPFLRFLLAADLLPR